MVRARRLGVLPEDVEDVDVIVLFVSRNGSAPADEVLYQCEITRKTKFGVEVGKSSSGCWDGIRERW